MTEPSLADIYRRRGWLLGAEVYAVHGSLPSHVELDVPKGEPSRGMAWVRPLTLLPHTVRSDQLGVRFVVYATAAGVAPGADIVLAWMAWVAAHADGGEGGS